MRGVDFSGRCTWKWQNLAFSEVIHMVHRCLSPPLKGTEKAGCSGYGGGCGSVCLVGVMISFSEAM